MVWESVKIAAAQAALVKMEKFRVLDYFSNSDLELREKIVPKQGRNFIVLPKYLVEVRLDPLVEANFHGA